MEETALTLDSLYIGVPIGAFFCFLFIFFSFLNAADAKAVRYFRQILLSCLIWTGGMVMMRMQIMPGIRFWFHVSVFGLLTVPIFMYAFLFYMLEIRKNGFLIGFCIATAAAMGINIATEVFIPEPDIVRYTDGSIGYTYHISWGSYLLAVVEAGVIVYATVLAHRAIGNKLEKRKKLFPLLLGTVLVLTGNLLDALPGNQFPYDMLGGIFMALCLLYIMWHKYLFDLSNRIVIGCIYSVALAVSLLPVFNFNHNAQRYLGSVLPEMQQKIIVIVLGFMGWSLFIFYLASKMAEGVMQGQNRKQIEVLRCFQNESASVFRQEELFDKMIGVVNEMFPVIDVFIFTRNENKFTLAKTGSGQMPGQEEQEEIAAMLEEPGIGERSEISLMKYDNEIQGFIYIKLERRTRLNYLERDYYWRIGLYASVCLKNIRTYQEVYQISIHDELTGLYNRGYFKKFLMENWKVGQPVALLYLDLDDFKLFNELYGEECGDRILKWCGHIIENTVGCQGETFRFGSNEYVVLINSGEKREVSLIAQKIQKNFLIEDKEKPDVLQPVTASIGIAFYPDTASGEDELLSQAERANFYAKRDGKNCIKIYGERTEDEIEDQKVEKHYEQIAPTIYALTAAIDAKDSYTFEHSCHVSDYAVLLAKKIGLSPDDIEIVKEAGLLHDIGKIGIPESILKKQGRLNAEEYEIMKTHVTNSIEMIHFLPNMNYVIPAVLSHHERYDGKGYPRGLKGEDIPLLGRILAVCDSFDAMTTKRSYKEAMPVDYAISELERNKGTQFDPKLSEAFVELLKEGKIEV